MERRIIFGWHLDGPRYPEEPALGSLAVGPIGLLHQLALRLALLRPFAPQAVRIADYLALLRQHDDGNQFYSRSFQTDQWGTASALLRLRDEAVAAGWQSGLTQEGCSNRLKWLATIEANAPARIACITDLGRQIAEVLERGASLPIDEIVLCDLLDHLPPMWNRMVSAIERNGVSIKQLELSPLTDGSDIANLGHSLLEYSPSCTLNGDGTFAVAEADDEVQAADLVASWLRTQDSNSASTVIIRDASTSILDQFLRKAGLPKIGCNLAKSQQSFLQLLPLCLEMSFRPLDVARYIEFLMLPNCPLPRFAADCFIHALKNQPGIGGSAWKNAWTVALERKRTAIRNHGEQSEMDNLEKIIGETEQEWRQWLEPPACEEDGMLVADVVAACKRVRQYALRLMASRGNAVFARGAVLADTLAAAAEAAGAQKLPRAQLGRMLETVMNDASSADDAEASPWTAVDHPGQIFAPVDTVLWWGFTSERIQPHSHPWSAAELSYFAENGVQLETPATRMVREGQSWRRPFVAPCKRLMLIRPRTVAGREAAAHPLSHELAEYLERSTSATRGKIIVQAHQLYQKPEIAVIGQKVKRVQVAPMNVPAKRSVWQVAPERIAPQAQMPSTLERLLGCPLSWVLRFIAQVRPGNLLSVADGDQLAGNLAHAVFAELFSTNNDSASSAEFSELAGKVFDDMCARTAAPLLMPGKSLELHRLKRSVCEGAAHLRELMRTAGFGEITCESEVSRELEDLRILGRPDMVLHGKEGNADFIVDLKWARQSAYRRRELSEGKAIQLAVYSWLASNEEKPAAAGYYMLSQKQLFSSAAQPFPPYTHVKGPSLKETFAKMIASYAQHMKHLSAGTVYATGVINTAAEENKTQWLSDVEPEQEASPVPNVELVLEPPCKFCDYGRICGVKEFAQ
jgi:ATP-dependent helicase/nuclease subunit B